MADEDDDVTIIEDFDPKKNKPKSDGEKDDENAQENDSNEPKD